MDWANLLVRWLHVISGVAWIGASFYFVFLDNHLTPPRDPKDTERGVYGELWSVHGGGFYHNQKYLLGPQHEPLTEALHWFKWEAYITWISGMLLLGIVYWHGAAAYLIDRQVADLTPAGAIAISSVFLVGGWLTYDQLCKRIKTAMRLGMAVFALIVVADVLLFRIFSGRGAYIHVGAMIGTLMVANVFFVIIPGQMKMVDAIRAGQAPDPVYGQRGKQRSVHNTYFTLPLLFIMISSHYPMTYNHPYGWAVLLVIMLAGVLARAFFLQRHKGRANPLLAVAGAVLIGVLAVALVPAPRQIAPEQAAVASFAQVRSVIQQRCNTCHSAKPSEQTFTTAPAGVMFDTPEQIRSWAARIHARAVVNKSMPLGNLTGMTEAERVLLDTWYNQGAPIR